MGIKMSCLKSAMKFDYTFEMNKLTKVVVQINNLNSEMAMLEEIAKDMAKRMPIFMPKFPSFHTYGEQDLVAQDYIQYLPKIFQQEKYVAILTTPNGRKCTLLSINLVGKQIICSCVFGPFCFCRNTYDAIFYTKTFNGKQGANYVFNN